MTWTMPPSIPPLSVFRAWLRRELTRSLVTQYVSIHWVNPREPHRVGVDGNRIFPLDPTLTEALHLLNHVFSHDGDVPYMQKNAQMGYAGPISETFRMYMRWRAAQEPRSEHG